jgi:hypothetical protein
MYTPSRRQSFIAYENPVTGRTWLHPLRPLPEIVRVGQHVLLDDSVVRPKRS